MNSVDVIQYRLYNQQLITSTVKTPGEIVKWFGAVQAQDYLGSLWAIGLRLKNVTETDIEKAIVDRTIVRSWPMRGTLHFAPSEDIRWMLKLLTPRVIARSASLYKQAGLDNKVFLKSKKLFEKAFQNGDVLTRDEMYEVLERGKISTGNYRGLHILGHLAQDAFICFGPRKGKQPTFVLLDSWIPPAKPLKRDEALGEIARRYFISHGPATLQDFAWWSGLTTIDAKEALEMVKSELTYEPVNKLDYWFASLNSTPKTKSTTAFLLPAYDEYSVAYKDRTMIIDPKYYADCFGKV